MDVTVDAVTLLYDDDDLLTRAEASAFLARFNAFKNREELPAGVDCFRRRGVEIVLLDRRSAGEQRPFGRRVEGDEKVDPCPLRLSGTAIGLLGE